VFVWLDGACELAPFEEAARELGAALAAQGLDRAKVAVENPPFTPGPYALEREYNVIAFDAWYLERMSSTGLGAWGSR
jgi:phenylpropionate dioxygenase-like ring-hydroxylating dioxygenase large terminal subunit